MEQEYTIDYINYLTDKYDECETYKQTCTRLRKELRIRCKSCKKIKTGSCFNIREILINYLLKDYNNEIICHHCKRTNS
jgi:hypothetical protein